jgi:exodeoxyribonuclease VII large subunit
MSDDYVSVTELNLLIKDEIKKSLKHKILIKGELSGYKKHGTTIYSTLKDDMSSINIIKFKSTENFSNGDLVLINGFIDYYTKNGNINLICNKIESTGEGEGNIQKRLTELKNKYENLGYFNNKKTFPKEIKSIGIITAKDGAALQDILFVLNSHKFNANIYIKNSPVQGVDCPRGICEGIRYFNNLVINNKSTKIDLIMITRGGGGIDDLIGFSHPDVIEEIHKSEIFTMSAVGHEIDNMLSDYVADIRAPTPSIGAEIICKACINKDELIKNYKEKIYYSKNIIINKLDYIKKNFFSVKKKMYVTLYEKSSNKIDELDKLFENLISNKFKNIKNDIDKLKSNIELLKNNEYNAIIIKNNKIIKSINDIKNTNIKNTEDNIYEIKINGKIKKVKIIPFD